MKVMKNSVCIPTVNSYSPPSFNIFQWNFVPKFCRKISPVKQTRFHDLIWPFLVISHQGGNQTNFSEKSCETITWLIYEKKIFNNEVYNKTRITLSKASNFSDFLFHFLFSVRFSQCAKLLSQAVDSSHTE